MSQSEIAKQLKVRLATISKWNHHSLFMEALSAARIERRKHVMEMLDGAGKVAIDGLLELARGGPRISDAVRRQACSDLADRVGITREMRLDIRDGRDESDEELQEAVFAAAAMLGQQHAPRLREVG